MVKQELGRAARVLIIIIIPDCAHDDNNYNNEDLVTTEWVRTRSLSAMQASSRRYVYKQVSFNVITLEHPLSEYPGK